MRVLAVVPSIYDTSPGQRYRIEEWEPLLRQSGVEITYAPFESEELHELIYKSGQTAAKVRGVLDCMLRRRRELNSLGDFDLIYLFREAALIGPPWFERKLARSGIPIVFDFDDAIFHSYKSPSNGYLSYLKFPGKTAEICSLATHIMAGNQYLADYATEYNASVTIVPTTIDTDKYMPADRSPVKETVTIGWSGSFSTIQHLDTIREMLQELARMEKFKLRVIGTPAYDLPGVEVEAMPWRAVSETEDLSAIDIGLMPLPNDKWSKGKCGFKALQYMGLGIPVICSPVGVNTKIVTEGQNGFWADNKSEWLEKIKTLMHSHEMRQNFGRAGRETVEREYSAKAIVPSVISVFRSAVETCERVKN